MLFLAASALAVTLQTGKTCLHDRSTETPDQLARRFAAVTVARALNTAEAQYSRRFAGSYADIPHLLSSGVLAAGATDGAQGFTVRLDLAGQGYWFEVADQQDACGFRFVSNERGLIFEAQPIR
jgi:hypothetical protein